MARSFSIFSISMSNEASDIFHLQLHFLFPQNINQLLRWTLAMSSLMFIVETSEHQVDVGLGKSHLT